MYLSEHIKVDFMNKMKKKDYFVDILAPIAFFIFIVIVLEICISIFNIPRIILPRPTAVFSETIKYFASDLFIYMMATFSYILAGILIAVPIGILLASVFSQYQLLVKAVTPIIILTIVTPMITLIPVFKLWFGFSPYIRILVVIVQAIPIVTLNTLSGFTTVEKAKLEFMKSTGATKLQTFTKVIFPNALPQVFTGIKLGCIFATIATISADFVLAGMGLGARIIQYAKYILPELMYGCVILIAIIGITFYQVVSAIEKRVIVWKK